MLFMVTRHEGSQCVDNERYIALSEPDCSYP